MNFSSWTRVCFLIVSCNFLFLQERPKKPTSEVEFKQTIKFLEFSFKKDYFKYTGRNIEHKINFISIKNPHITDFFIKDNMVMSKIIPVEGYCDRDSADVYVSEESWKNAIFLQKMAIVYHELGHCSLGREHFTQKAHNTPVSIMFPNILPDRVINANFEFYKRELFINNYIYDDGSGVGLNDYKWYPQTNCSLIAI